MAFVFVASSFVAGCAQPDEGMWDAGPIDVLTDVHVGMDVHADVRPDVRPDVHDVVDVAVDVAHDTGHTCVPTCASNLDCQSSCASSSTGTNCCDMTTHHCYLSAAMCPATTPDSGMMMYP